MHAESKTWVEWVDEEELAFIRRFVLTSGSLKALAAAYGVTYPTIRLRLDRLIQKLQIIEDQQITSDFERLLRVKFAEGRLDAGTFRSLLHAHRKGLETEHGNLDKQRRDG